MHPQQLADTARAARARRRPPRSNDSPRPKIITARRSPAPAPRSSASTTDGRCRALVSTSAELAAAVGHHDHARTIEALCDLHAAAITLAARGTIPAPRTAHRTGARR